jgi:hypothetical protein
MSRSHASASPDANELRVVVWQFVRIMVQLESVARSRGRERAPTVYGDWRSAWTEVDRTLERLGKSEPDAFADLMMNQEVVLRCRDRTQVNDVVRAIENVIHQIDQQIRAVTGDGQAEEDLRFERKELNALAKKLRGQGRGPKRAPATAKQAGTGGARGTGRGGGARRGASRPRRGPGKKAP